MLRSESVSLGPAVHEALASGVPILGFYPQAEQCLRTVTMDCPPEDLRLLLYSRTRETLRHVSHGDISRNPKHV